MADGNPEDFDMCDCVWSHELATRRLINMIRQNTDYCAENECYNEVTGEGSPDGGTTAMFFLGFWFFIALVLLFLRPRSAMPETKRRDDLGPSFDPPPPSTN